MIEIIEPILMLILFALIVALIVGLINPALVLQWSKKPTRLKILGWWFLSSFVILLFIGILEGDNYTSEERMNMAKTSIANGNYSNAVNELKKIKQEDVEYAEAQTLLVEAENLLLIADAEREAQRKSNVVANSRKITNPSRITTAEEGMSYLDGKTFIATPKGERWYKVTFSGDSFTLWTALPQYGSWGEVWQKGTYSIKEDRFANTGERYFYITLFNFLSKGGIGIHLDLDALSDRLGNMTLEEQVKGSGQILENLFRQTCSIIFVVSDLSFRVETYDGEEQTAIAKVGDRNPWN